MAQGKQKTWDGRRLQAEDRRQARALKAVADSVPTASQLPFVGMQALVADATEPPQEWHFCDGAELRRQAYPEAFAALGTVHGAGDGSTTFNLPDLTGVQPPDHRYFIYLGRA